MGSAYAEPVPPPAEDLGETTEVRFTTAIQDLAGQLGNDPVAIYHWVRNNIAYEPTWGSLYGADFCLSVRACNAFDTSSLLIALYRVSDIPAHYVRGQIRVPIEQAQRWFRSNTPEAALAALTVGGVPATFVTDEAGEVTAIQLEHVWVKAWVDYIPSRGEVEKQGDQSIVLDAGFKETDANSAIVPRDDPILLGTLPYQIVSVTSEAAALFDADRDTGEPPTVVVGDPVDLGNGQVQIWGTVTDDNFVRYRVDYALSGSNTFIPLASGSQPVTDGPLATFDTTVLENGLYDIRVTVVDSFGNSQSVTITQEVTGELKLGKLALEFQDLVIPVPGIPIIISRAYSSFDKSPGSFGIGWGLGLADIKLQEGPNRSVFLTLPDGRRVKFAFKLSPLNFLYSQAEWTPARGVYDQLEMIGSKQVLIDNASGRPLYFTDGLGIPYECFEPSGYILTLQEGTRVEIKKEFLGDEEHYSPLCGKTYFGPVYGPAKISSIQDPNGNTLQFTDNGIIHSAGKSMVFKRDAQKRIYEIVDSMGGSLTYGYDASGDLTASSDAMGNTTRYSYDQNHNLLEVTEPSGNRILATAYDPSGRMLSATNGAGNSIGFSYSFADGEEVVRDPRGVETHYRYNQQGEVTGISTSVTIDGETVPVVTEMEYDDAGNLVAVTDPDGNRREMAYDASGNLIRAVTDPGGLNLATEYTIDSRGHLQKITNPKGDVVLAYAYDSAGNLTRFEDGVGNAHVLELGSARLPSRIIDPSGNIRAISYDAEGHPIEEKLFDAQGGVARTQSFTYDANGNRLTETTLRTVDGQQMQVTTHYTYDAANRLIATTDPLGNVTRTEYDANGRPSAYVDTAGHRTEMEYDAAGRLSRTRFSDGSTESHTYDATGNIVEQTDRAGRITRFEYDELGRAVKTVLPDGAASSTTYSPGGLVIAQIDANGNRSDFQHDAAGRLTQVDLPSVVDAATGQVYTPQLRYEYDAAGHRTAEIDPAGHRNVYGYDPTGRITTLTYADGSFREMRYDARGQLQQSVDEEGRVTEYLHDADGNLQSVTLPAPSPQAPRPVTTYMYDEVGNRVSQTDALGRTTRFDYDPGNRLVRRTLPGGQAESYVYDELNNLVAHTDFNGATTEYEYDSLSRLAIKRYPDGSSVRFEYTPTGQIAKISDGQHSRSFEYGDRGQLVGVQDSSGNTILYDYDVKGNVVRIRTPNGEVTYAYDVLDRLVQLDGPGGQADYGYGHSGTLDSVILGNGTSTEYRYDTRNRLVGITHRGLADETLASFQYTLSPAGQRLRVVEHGGSEVTYVYDRLDRLTSETRTGATPFSASYEYDAVGNRLRRVRNGEEIQYSYDANDQLKQAGGAVYEYDANGNVVGVEDNSETFEYTYDPEDRLTDIVHNGLHELSYGYDLDGLLASKVGPDSSWKFLQAGVNPTGLAQIFEAYEENTGRTILNAFGNRPVSSSETELRRYYHADGLGSTRSITGRTGSSEVQIDYDAFGNMLEQRSLPEGLYLFAGELFDGDSGLYYLRNRNYVPSVGRFTTRDKSPGLAFQPITLNAYVYADANPVNRIDPTGLVAINIPDITGAIIGRSLVADAYWAAQGKTLTEFLNASKYVAKALPFIKCVAEGILNCATFRVNYAAFNNLADPNWSHNLTSEATLYQVDCKSEISEEFKNMKLPKKISIRLYRKFDPPDSLDNDWLRLRVEWGLFYPKNSSISAQASFSIKSTESFFRTIRGAVQGRWGWKYPEDGLWAGRVIDVYLAARGYTGNYGGAASPELQMFLHAKLVNWLEARFRLLPP